jgi:hypothetical protein
MSSPSRNQAGNSVAERIQDAGARTALAALLATESVLVVWPTAVVASKLW